MVRTDERVGEAARARKYLTFVIGGEIYGVGISYVREIIGLQPITPLPEVPDYVKGVVNLRGRVIPVMCVRARIGKPPQASTPRTCIVVVTIGEDTVGLVVDTVSEVLEIPSDKIEAPPRVARGGQHFLRGMGNVGDQVRLLLNVAQLLGVEEELEAA